jgi:hypothetical protein
VGAGGSLEAAYTRLRDPIPAGTWRLVADGIIIEPVDVRFEILLRPAAGPDIELAAFEHHFEPLPGSVYEAQPFEATAEVDEVEPRPDDRLIFRYSGESESLQMAYIPNGDGELLGGRIPFIELPR